MLLLRVYWKADLALFLRPDLEKEKNKEQIWPGAVRLKIIILRAVIQSWNFADFDLYIGGETGKLRNLGFRQCKTIIMPLIPICYPSVSCCRRCLRCAKRCSFCSAVSCWRLLLRCSRWIWSQRSRSRGFSFRKLQIFISQTTEFHFVSFHFVSQTTVSPGDKCVCLGFTCKFFACFKFNSDWGRVIGKIKQNKLDCRNTAPLNSVLIGVNLHVVGIQIVSAWITDCFCTTVAEHLTPNAKSRLSLKVSDKG